MLYISIEGKTITIDETLKVKGPEPFNSVIRREVRSIDPEKNHATNNLAFLYYALEDRGYDVEADEGDLSTEELPKGAVS